MPNVFETKKPIELHYLKKGITLKLQSAVFPQDVLKKKKKKKTLVEF